VFFPKEGKMTPAWLPWSLIGGLCFIIFGFIGTKYKEKPYQRIQFLQDFVSGSILITIVGIIMPDLFPEISLPEISSTVSGKISSDDEIQVGPPRLMRY
jgi:hypothetical protein